MTRVTKNKEILELKDHHVEQRNDWEAANRKREEHNSEELAQRRSDLANREGEYKATVHDLNSRNDATTLSNRQAHEREMKNRLDDMHTAANKFHSDLEDS